MATARRLKLAATALASVAVLSGASYVAYVKLGGDPAPKASETGYEFTYLAHDIVPQANKASPDPLYQEFGGASGLAYVPGSATGDGSARFLAVSDAAAYPKVYELRAQFSRDPDGGWALETELLREIPLPHPLRDAESIVILEGESEFPRYAIAYEAPLGVAVFTTEPHEDGRTRGTLLNFPEAVREHARGNRGFESLTIRTRPDGVRELWSVMESSLTIDGDTPTGSAGATVRAFVHTVNGDGTFTLDRELTYITDPLPKALAPIGRVNSVSEALTLPDGEVAVLERSATVLGGYNIRIHRVTEREGGTLEKRYIFGVKAKVGDALPWIGNFEGCAVGPSMAELTGDAAERGHLMLFIADDNFGTDHQRGTMVMGVRLNQSR